MRTLGLIGGLSWESTAIYYRLLNEGVRDRLGGLHSAQLLLWSFDFATVDARQAVDDWDGLATVMVETAQRLEQAGADAVLICANTMHRVAEHVAARIEVPLIHIADAAAVVINKTPCRRPALLATRYTMEQDFYRDRLRDRHGIDAIVPDAGGRHLVHQIIFDELCRGIVSPASKQVLVEQVGLLRERGADGLILGCTEVGLILSQSDFSVPVFDTALLHVDAALKFLCPDASVASSQRDGAQAATTPSATKRSISGS